MVLSSKSSSNVLNSLSLRVALAKVYRLANVVFSVCQNGRIVDHWGQPPINDFQKSEKKRFQGLGPVKNLHSFCVWNWGG
jgi:hypothetical protein